CARWGTDEDDSGSYYTFDYW
nr:immunoglobulin heavy chain junction region [Macaca mulatta]MOW79690.1 immunoglobulin heavy chain junction region [Macaca mulatta]MOW80578.1 immunoglobulin heavy chain junction region [Macaca mulatta]MOW80762.1 immunoglobulin heavy chain junction region [Macaca mulatta]MOW81068.1 immunoglobulin heavy chain junction region [Macaca mulatta]